MTASASSVSPASGRMSKTKIVATVGPASDGEEMLARLIVAGVDVFRLNMAHGSRAEHQRRLAAIRAASDRAGQVVAVLADLAGPKMRLGELPGGELRVQLDDRVRFVRGTASSAPGELTSSYPRLVDELAAGDRVMLADGTVGLVVESTSADAAECRVVQSGLLRSRQGINLPGVKLSVAALGPADRENALWAAAAGIDFVGLSFVRTAAEIDELVGLLRAAGAATQVIAKIEKPEALAELESIIDAADGIMVARGDLGVETDIAEVALVQKRIVGLCHARRKPVIVATQMLDSMQHESLPTRAEVTDVANAILDGADACMLSGETAVGEHPVEAVAMMHRIALATEPLLDRCRPASVAPPSGHAVTEAMVEAAGRVAEAVGARLVAVASASGQTALALSKRRGAVPTVGISAAETTLRRMCLYWGVFPARGAPIADQQTVLAYLAAEGRRRGAVQPGDRIVLVSGTGLPDTAHNALVVHQI